MITRLAISGYRSLRDIVLDLGQLTVVTGPNGSGKSSLYRALRLLAETAQGRIIHTLAVEGGWPSTIWAGPETISRGMRSGEVPVQGTVRRKPVSLKLGFGGDDYGYAIDLGMPAFAASARTLFNLDPVIKIEAVWTGALLGRANLFAERRGPLVRVRGEDGAWRQVFDDISGFDSMMTHAADPREALELLVLRDRLRRWRFYDQMRTDRDAPMRRPQIGTLTPALASDGADLAAALRTIQEIGNAAALAEVIADAFPGCHLEIVLADGLFDLAMQQYGLLRPLRAAELSDGTLRYLLLIAALLSPRPPELMILNEPEASLHPDLLAPLARLITRAAERSQIIVVSHSAALVADLDRAGDCRKIALEKILGETVIPDSAGTRWVWPSR